MFLRFNHDIDNALAWADELFRHIDRQQVEGLGRLTGRSASGPVFHLFDTGAALVVQGLVPGLSDKDIDIQATATSITVSGERKLTSPEGYRLHRQERAPYRFTRSFKLPTRVDLERTAASVKDGVLTIEMQKLPEVQPKTIAVHAG